MYLCMCACNQQQKQIKVGDLMVDWNVNCLGFWKTKLKGIEEGKVGNGFDYLSVFFGRASQRKEGSNNSNEG